MSIQLDYLPDDNKKKFPSILEGGGVTDLDFLPDQLPKLPEVYNSVIEIDPVKAAKIMDLSKRLDQPEVFIDKNLPNIEKFAQAPTGEFWLWFEKNFPKSASYVSNPKYMAVAKDLLPELSVQENLFNQISRGFKSGKLNAEYAELGWQQMLDSLVTGRRSKKNEKRLQEIEAEILTIARPDFAPFFYVAEQLPNLGLMAKKGLEKGLITGGTFALGALVLGQAGPQAAAPEEAVTVPGAFLAGLGTGGKIGVAEAAAILEGGAAFREFAKLKDRNGNPIDPRLAAQAALVVGILNAGLEYASAKLLLRTIPGGDKIAKFFNQKEIKNLAKKETSGKVIREGVKRYLQSIIGETITEITQETVTQLGGEAAKTISGQPFEKKGLEEILSDSAQVISPAMQSAGVFGLPGLGLHIMQGTRRINQAKTDSEVYKAVGNIAEKSQYLERLPEGWRELIEMHTKDGKLENIYIDTEPLISLLQEMAPKGITGEEAARIVADELGVGDQLRVALETGKPLQVPYSVWLEKVVKTPLYKKMEEHIKFSEDGLTLAQATLEANRTNQMIIEEQSRAEELIAQSERNQESYQFVYDDVKNKLLAAGRPQNIRERDWNNYVDKSAQIWAAHAVAESARRGIDVVEWYQGANKPKIVKADFMPAEIGPEIRSKLDTREIEFLDVLAERNQSIEFIEQELENEYARILQEQIDYLSQSGGKGVEQGHLIKDDQGNVVDRVGRRSKNPKWYQDFYAEKGRAPSKKELRELALKQLREGYLDDTAEVPPNVDFVSIENTLTGIRNLRSKIAAGMEGRSFNQPVNPGVDPERQVKIVDLTKIIPANNRKELLEHLKGLANTKLSPADREWLISILPKKVRHIVWSSVRVARKDIPARNASIQSIEDLIQNSVLIESIPNQKLEKKPNIETYHRFYVPVRIGKKVYTVRLVAEQDRESIKINPKETVLYDVVIENNQRFLPPNQPAEAVALVADRETADTISIRQMLVGVKDYAGQTYYQGSTAAPFYSKLERFIDNENRARVDIYPEQSIITLFSKADASSFLHESAHLFLNDMFEFVKSGQADERYLEDWDTLSKWLGVREGQDKLTVEQQEKFARGVEAYLMEGNAPSEKLRKAFSSFRRWLVKIYRTVAGLNVEITSEVRAVMDRLFATEEEIRERQALNGYLHDIFGDKDIPKATRKHLEELREKAHEMAVMALLKPQMDELKPEHEEFMRQERERLRKIIEEQVAELRIYRAMEAIRNAFGLNKDPRKIAREYRADGGLTRKGNRKLDVIADAYGYSSGAELAQEVLNAPSFYDEVTERLEVQMAGMFGDLRDSMEFSYEAEKAVRNEYQLDVLALEKEIFMDLLQQEEDLKQSKRQIALERARIRAQAARKYAKAILNEKPFREAMAATSYFAAERNAAVKEANAYHRKDVVQAAKYAEQRIINHALAVEAIRIKTETDKIFKYLERFRAKRRPNILQSHLNQIDKILARFKFIDLTPNSADDPVTLNEWIASRENFGDAAIPESIADETFSKDYHELTLGELRDLVQAIKNIETVARNEKRQLTDEKNREFEEIVSEITASIYANQKQDFIGSYDPNQTQLDAVKHNLRGFVADHRKVEWIVRALDGYKDQGPAWRYIVLPFMRALDNEYKLRREAGEKLTEIFRKYYGKDTSSLATEKIYVQEVAKLFPKGLTKENVLVMALNWGNEGNRKRLIDSYIDHNTDEPMATPEMIQAAFDQVMTENDWAFVQEIWDYIDTYWPMIAKDKQIRTGVEPKKVEATPVETRFGTFRGGYYPIVYDPRMSEKASRQAEEDSLKDLFNLNYLKPATKRGFENERVETVTGRPLDLRLSVIDRHVADVIHSVSFANAVRDVDRLINNRKIQQAIKATMGDEVYKQFRPWIMGIARDNRDLATVGPWGFVEKILNRARVGAAIVNMGYKLTTAFSQLAGLFPLMERIGAGRTLSGVMEFYGKVIAGQAGKDIDFVFQKSEMMRNRMSNRDRDIRDATKKLLSKGKLDEIKDTYFTLTGLFDYAVTIPGWIQSYNKNIEEQLAAGKVEEELAVRYADQVIRETQGSGDVVNMAAFQRGSEVQKLLTQFYSYFSVYANRQIEAFERAKRHGEIGKLVSFAIYWWFLPALVSELLAGRGPGGDDEDKLKWLLATILKYPAGAFIIMRDLANAIGGYGEFDISPSSEAFGKVAQFISYLPKTIRGEVEPGKLLKIGFEAGGYWMHYPAKQISTTVGNVYEAIVDGEDFYLRDLFFPKPIDRR